MQPIAPRPRLTSSLPLLLLLQLLDAADALTLHGLATTSRIAPSLSRSSHAAGLLQVSFLQATRSLSPSCCAVANNSSTSPSELMDPRDAVKEIGSLLEQVGELWSQGSSWDVEKRTARRRELVATYLRVFAPAVAFSGVQLAVSLFAFLFILLGLNLNNHGYADVQRWSQDISWLANALERVDPSFGNAAIALLAVEVLAPLLIGVSLAAAPAATKALQETLNKSGLDADGINARIEKVLENTS